MNDEIDELINSGQNFNFRNNSNSKSYGTYTCASDELLSWIAIVESFISNNYGDESAAFKLIKDVDKSKFNGYEQDDFEEQMNIINGALKTCKKIPLKLAVKTSDDNLIIQLLKNIYFWTVLVVISGGAFGLGLHFGNSKFDKEKIEFYETTKKQEVKIDSLKEVLIKKNDSISLL